MKYEPVEKKVYPSWEAQKAKPKDHCVKCNREILNAEPCSELGGPDNCGLFYCYDCWWYHNRDDHKDPESQYKTWRELNAPDNSAEKAGTEKKRLPKMRWRKGNTNG